MLMLLAQQPRYSGWIYRVGGHNYQNIKKFERPKLRIDHKQIVEIDINVLYLSILHGISGYPLSKRDNLHDFIGTDQAIIKAWISSTIDHHCFHTIWSRTTVEPWLKVK